MNPTRERLLQALAEMSQLHPEWRFGQMIANLAFLARQATTQQKAAEDIWDIEDDELVAALTEHIKKRRQALQDKPATVDSNKVA